MGQLMLTAIEKEDLRYVFKMRSYLTAEVAKTWPLEPTESTTTEATTTIRSVVKTQGYKETFRTFRTLHWLAVILQAYQSIRIS